MTANGKRQGIAVPAVVFFAALAWSACGGIAIENPHDASAGGTGTMDGANGNGGSGSSSGGGGIGSSASGAGARGSSDAAAGGCSATTCAGCCDPNGFCADGLGDTLCGTGGSQCRNCTIAGWTCQAGSCAQPDASSSSGSPGGGACTCPGGCCDSTTTCQPGTADNACGQPGSGMCTDCTAFGETCVRGLCGGCVPADCMCPPGSSRCCRDAEVGCFCTYGSGGIGTCP